MILNILQFLNLTQRERKNSNVPSFSIQNNNKKRTKKHFNSRSDEKARDIEK